MNDKVLWHYTDPVSAFKITDSASLHLTDYRYMNDPTEGFSYLEMLQSKYPEERNRVWVDAYIDEVKRLARKHRAFVFSLSKTQNDLGQWVGYGGISLGFAIEENTPRDVSVLDCVYSHVGAEKTLKELGIENLVESFAITEKLETEIKYCEQLMVIDDPEDDFTPSEIALAQAKCLELEEQWPEVIRNLKLNLKGRHWEFVECHGKGLATDMTGGLPTVVNEIWVNAFKCKHEDYKNEAEVRLVKTDVPQSSVKYKSSHGGIIPYWTLNFGKPYSPLTLKKVQIGPYQYKERLQQQWKEYLESIKDKIGDVELLPPSDTPYNSLL